MPLKFKKPKQKPSETTLPEIPLPTKRYSPPALTSSSLVSLRNEEGAHLCVFGGILDNSPVNETWLYDLETKKWITVQEGRDDEADSSPQALQRKKLRSQQGYAAQYPQARCGHNAVAVAKGKEMLVFGGANICTAAYYNDLWSFDADIYEWKKVGPAGFPPQPRWQSSAVAIEDRVFIYAGEGQQYNLLSDVNAYSHEAQEWLKLRTIHPSPPARMMHAAVAIGDRMYVIGGRGRESLCDVWCFETRTSMWSQVSWRSQASPFMSPDGNMGELYGHVAIPYNHCVLVHGGKLRDSFPNVSWLLDTRDHSWHALEVPTGENTSPPPRWKHCATTLVDVQATPAMKEFTPLSEMNLADEAAMRKWIQAQKDKLRQQHDEAGLLSSLGSTTVVSTTKAAYIFGGATPGKKLLDLWSLKLL